MDHIVFYKYSILIGTVFIIYIVKMTTNNKKRKEHG